MSRGKKGKPPGAPEAEAHDLEGAENAPVEAPAEVDAPTIAPAPPAASPTPPRAGLVWCEALRTVLTPGEPSFAGAKFWMDREMAERLERKGDLRIL